MSWFCVGTLMGPGHHRVQFAALFLTPDAVALFVSFIHQASDCVHNPWFSYPKVKATISFPKLKNAI